MRYRKMLISCVKLDHMLYSINYGIYQDQDQSSKQLYMSEPDVQKIANCQLLFSFSFPGFK